MRRFLFLLAVSAAWSVAVAPAAAQPSGYPSLATIESQLLSAEQIHPAICKRYLLGNSVLGRPIWALRISDNVLIEEDEPEMRWISSMHGDEVTGIIMCLNLIDEITDNYGSDSRLTDIVDSMDTWIVPLMNPDGYVALTRGNANGVDLNRDFPDPYTSPNNTTAGRQAETAVIMNWTFGRSFVLAANLHGGTLVVNYPYDNNPSGSSVYTASPDDDLFIYISEEYSRYNLPMWNSGSFFHGITNGADWYAISGGMQDWLYRYHGGNEVTIEIGNTKTPPYAQMPTYWNDNREAMLAYMETCLLGVRGIVTDANNGDPVSATLRVAGRNQVIHTDSDVGNFHRMLLAGAYDLTFEAPGYDSVTARSVAVGPGPATRLDVALGEPTEVVWPNGGEAVPAGVPSAIEWAGNPQTAFRLQYTSNYGDTDVTTDGFESGALEPTYTTGGNASWVVVAGGAHSGIYRAKSGTISHNQTSWLKRSFGGGSLSFWYRVSSEATYDFLNFYVDGVRYVQVSGEVGWTQYSTNLPTGTTYELTWEYTKDGSLSSGSDAGWIDDLQMTVDNTNWVDIGVSAVGASSYSWTPTVVTADCKVRARAEYSPTMSGAWDESDTVFTVEEGPQVPAVSAWGIATLALLMLSAATVVLGKRMVWLRAHGIANESGGLHMKRKWNLDQRRTWLVALGVATWTVWPSNAAPPRSIYDAVAAGERYRVETMLTADSATVNQRDGTGATPLHAAVRSLRPDMATLLLERGAEINAADRDGFTPLHLAAYVGRADQGSSRTELVKLLIEHRADVRAADAQGNTPLHIAAIKGRAELLPLLREAGAEVAARDKLGRTPLHGAAMYNQAAVVKWLLGEKADVGATDGQGRTPLHAAVLRYRAVMITQLLDAGAAVNARDAAGATPLILTAAAGEEEHELDTLATAVAEALITRGADVTAVDDSGRTALQHAEARGMTQLAERLRANGAE